MWLMASQSAVATRVGRVSFNWIIDKKNDLIYYIGSSLLGWFYAGIILLAVLLLPDWQKGAFTVIKLGGIEIPLTVELLVYSSWAFLFDAPHIWSTLTRTFFDPEERRDRRRELWVSWGWFFLGPVMIGIPYLINAISSPYGYYVPIEIFVYGPLVFLVFFRLWAYYHVVRQHWGFFMLYKRKNNDMDARDMKIDKWFFNLSLYLPLVMFMTSSFYDITPGMPKLGLHNLQLSGFQISSIIYNLTWAIFLGVVLFYIGYQVRLWMRGRTLNGPKLLFMTSIVPLHLLTFNNPWLAFQLVALVTVGHNIQYHRVVWMYGQNKYEKPGTPKQFTIARFIFSRFWIYFGMGVLFTFALYRGPWITWLHDAIGLSITQSVLSSVGMMAGMKDPSTLQPGELIFASFFIGWAFQHYYLDSKIWRVGRDKNVAKQLKVEG
jgi:hypothetical protein